jgi:hypothetical protein
MRRVDAGDRPPLQHIPQNVPASWSITVQQLTGSFFRRRAGGYRRFLRDVLDIPAIVLDIPAIPLSWIYPPFPFLPVPGVLDHDRSS